MRQSSLSSKSQEAPANPCSLDECAHFVGHLALALIACHLQDVTLAKSYIARANASIAQLATEGFTVRYIGPMKMACVVTESSGLSETMLLPIVDDVLLLPRIDLESVVRAARISGPGISIINFSDIRIGYHSLRLRTGRLLRALADLANSDSLAAIAAVLQDILDQCLIAAASSPSTLDSADDYLMLTLNLARQNQCALAGMALGQAKKALFDYSQHANLPSHTKRVARLTTQIAELAKTLAASVS